MSTENNVDILFGSSQITQLLPVIATEFASRNLFPLRDFGLFVKDVPERELTVKCTRLHGLIFDVLSGKGVIDQLVAMPHKPVWMATALAHNIKDGACNASGLARDVCVGLLYQYRTTMDEHIDNLGNTELYERLGVVPADNMLVDLSDTHFELKRDGIIFDKSTLVYPHQFLRRYYSASFVGMPSLLMKAKKSGAKVSVRLDPLRVAEAQYYRDGPVEADYWHGPPFSEKILMDKRRSSRTQHRSTGVTDFTYDAAFTIFRTKMMDAAKGLREFMIEEYCPLTLRHGDKSAGVGEQKCIQKFAHFVYDQDKQCFTHLDGAVRVFTVEEYASYFDTVSAGDNVDEKIGKRHKLFLVEGELDSMTSQELLTEWFRYNSHIEEYFTGKDVKPLISYADLDAIISK